jgi:hypothetical protein
MIFDIILDNVIVKVTGEDVFQYDKSLLRGLTISIGKNQTKNDQDGNVHVYYYDKVDTSNGAYCFVESMYNCACICRPILGEAFFTCNTDKKKWKLTYDHYGAAVKAAAKLVGIKDLRGYTQKSTRVGATTTLAANDVPDYTIKDLGRWNSTAFMEYIRLSLKQFGRALGILTNVNSYTLEDAMRCDPKLSA